MVGGQDIDGLDSTFGVVIGIEVVSELVGQVLIGEFAEPRKAEWMKGYNVALTPAEICLLASPVISWLLVQLPLARKSRVRRRIYLMPVI